MRGELEQMSGGGEMRGELKQVNASALQEVW